MVREIVVFCDVCFEADVETRAATLELAVPATQRVTVDLCERHRAELVDPLAKVLNDHGQDVPDPVAVPVKRRGRPPTKKYAPRNVPCHLCGQTVATLDDHLRKEHRDEYLRQPGREAEECRLCGKYFVQGQGMASHIRNAHPELTRTAAELFSATDGAR